MTDDDMDEIYESHTMDILTQIGLKTDVLADDVKDQLKKYVEDFMVPLGEAKRALLRKYGVFQEEDKLIPPDCEEGYEVLVGKKRECSHESELQDVKYQLERAIEKRESVEDRYEKLSTDRYPIIEAFPPLRVKWLRPDFESFLRNRVPGNALISIAALFEEYSTARSPNIEIREFQYCLLEAQSTGWIRLYRQSEEKEDDTDIHHSMLGRLNTVRGWWEKFPTEEEPDVSDS